VPTPIQDELLIVGLAREHAGHASLIKDLPRSQGGVTSGLFGERSQAFNDALRASPFFRR
jgi:hypothetical protein